MDAGLIIRLTEKIVTVYCGVVLAVRPCKMRWKSVFARILFWILVSVGLLIACGNTFWFKFSAVEVLILAIYLFCILIVFFRIYFWQLFAQNFLYWFTLMIFHHFIVCICALTRGELIPTYLNETYEKPWHWLQVTSMLIVMAVSVFLLYIRRGQALIQCRFKRQYIWFVLPICAEFFIEMKLFSDKNLGNSVEKGFVIFCMLVLGIFISTAVVFIVYKAYREEVYKTRIIGQSMRVLRDQYQVLRDVYEARRCQMHDVVQQDILLMEYLKSCRYEEALIYLEKKVDKIYLEQKKKYTDMPGIDLILDYKMNRAAEYGIRVDLKTDVLFCPMEDDDMCVVLGNLMDNAIEAVQKLPVEKRGIHIAMKTFGDMFLMEIRNPFEGKRKQVEGYYLTTKEDKEFHGVGLGSVERIAKKYGGELGMSDDGEEFVVHLEIFAENCCKSGNNF